MMKTYSFNVIFQKTINKTVTVEADDIFKAHLIVKKQYPTYEVFAKPSNSHKRLY